MNRNSMVQRLMLMRNTMMATREAKRQEKYEERQKNLEQEAEKRAANMKLKKKRSYALKGAAANRHSK